MGYTISVKRAQDPNYVASSNNDLSGIAVDGFLLSHVFSTENTQYVIWLPYETENVTVSGTAADGKASVTVEGGSGLLAGQNNEVKVICTAEDGSQKIYTVIAKRAAAHDGSTEPQQSQEQETGDGIPWWTLLIVGVLCLAGGAAAGLFVDKKYWNKT